MPPGRPALTANAERVDDIEQITAHVVGIGYRLRELFARKPDPELVDALLEIARHAAVIKHLNERERDRLRLESK